MRNLPKSGARFFRVEEVLSDERELKEVSAPFLDELKQMVNEVVINVLFPTKPMNDYDWRNNV